MLAIEKPDLKFSNFNEEENYIELTVEPLERGYGVTLGNSLRRIMLSSLPGYAIKWVKFDDILHEFSSIEGVKEDVVDIILNIKALVFKINSDEEEKILKIEVDKAKEITAADIKADADVEIIDKSLHIATLTENKHFYMEMCLAKGRGYVSVEENKAEVEGSVNIIAVDSSYSPVKSANFKVTSTRVGENTNYDKLVHEVWTDGSMRPEEAVSLAAKFLNEHLSLYISLTETAQKLNVLCEKEVEEKEKVLEMTIEELDLAPRSRNCLKRAGINTIQELVMKSEDELLKIRNLGNVSLKDILEKLKEMELELKVKEI